MPRAPASRLTRHAMRACKASRVPRSALSRCNRA
nr:MAG TPA: hypothetical protein [Caudoviricetes sp.]